jgi:hypothetical protein
MLFQPLREIIFADKPIFHIRVVQPVAQFAALTKQNDVITLQLPRQAAATPTLLARTKRLS